MKVCWKEPPSDRAPLSYSPVWLPGWPEVVVWGVRSRCIQVTEAPTSTLRSCSVKSFMSEVTAYAASVGWGSDVGVGEAVEVALSPRGGGVGVSDSPQAPASTATAAITSVTNRYLVIL